MTHSAFTSYLHTLRQKLATGDATERSHYGTLDTLLAAFDINQTQYFEGIDPQVWTFEIGGYQVLHKWLRDRKRGDHPLSFDDLRHYQRIVVALEETMRLMHDIDALIDAHGGRPVA